MNESQNDGFLVDSMNINKVKANLLLNWKPHLSVGVKKGHRVDPLTVHSDALA